AVTASTDRPAPAASAALAASTAPAASTALAASAATSRSAAMAATTNGRTDAGPVMSTWSASPAALGSRASDRARASAGSLSAAERRPASRIALLPPSGHAEEPPAQRGRGCGVRAQEYRANRCFAAGSDPQYL